MACEATLKPRQTPQERAADVRRAVEKLAKDLASGRVKVRVGPQGAVAFEGWGVIERDGVSDACAYRKLMVTGSALAKAAIAKAEMLSGRKIDRTVVNGGVHSHDGGKTWHHGH